EWLQFTDKPPRHRTLLTERTKCDDRREPTGNARSRQLNASVDPPNARMRRTPFPLPTRESDITQSRCPLFPLPIPARCGIEGAAGALGRNAAHHRHGAAWSKRLYRK